MKKHIQQQDTTATKTAQEDPYNASLTKRDIDNGSVDMKNQQRKLLRPLRLGC